MNEAQLNDRLDRLYERSDREARAACIQGYGSNCEFDAERDRLITKLEDTLDELQKIDGTPRFHPAK